MVDKKSGKSLEGKQAMSVRAGSRKKPDVSSKEHGDWRDIKLAKLREMIIGADPECIEEVKCRKPSNPEGVPVWYHNGILCIWNILKNSVRLTFHKGAALDDEHRIFNSRLDSRTVRAIDFFHDDMIDGIALKSIILQSVSLNVQK
jgi:hypothetical protein